MKAYWVARSKIFDPKQYKKYTDLVPSIIKRYNGTILARGGDYEVLEGTKEFHRFVVIEFPSMKHAETFYHSNEYKKGHKYLNDEVADRFLNIAEGIN